MFQVCHVNAPADLDERLQRRGYRLQEPCTALAKRIAPDAAGWHDADIEIGDAPSEAWLSVYLAGITPSRRGLAPMILARVPAPRAFLLLRDQGQPAATALGVVAEGVAIAECVMTRADLRRVGAGSRVMRALEAWGARQGATIAALAGGCRQRTRAGALRQARLPLRRRLSLPRARHLRRPHAHCRQSQSARRRLVEDPGSRRRRRRAAFAGCQGAGYRAHRHRRLAGLAGAARGPRGRVRLSAHRRARQALRSSTIGT